jgi:integrase
MAYYHVHEAPAIFTEQLPGRRALMAAKAKVTAIRGDDTTLGAAADAFLSTSRMDNANTRRAYAGAIDRTVQILGTERRLADVADTEVGAALKELWGESAAATWNRNRAAVASWLTWCQTKMRWPAPSVPADLERRTEHPDETKAVGKSAIQRLLSRRDIPLRERTLWRMLYETAARASEILELDVQNLDLENRKAPITSKCGATQWVYWDTGTAHLLPRLLRLPDGTSRTSGPLFLSIRKPVPARRPAARDICPHTDRARLGYDRARVLLWQYAKLELHQLRHSAATHLGDAKVPLQLIMAKTRHKNPRSAMRYVKPGGEAVAEVTGILGPPKRKH